MIKNLILLFLFTLFLSSNAFAVIRPELFEEEENFEKLSNDDVKAKKDITLKNEAMITDTNSYTGIKDREYYTGNDHHKLSGSYQLNPRITKPFDFSSFELNYGYKMWGLWWQGFVARSAGTWDTVAENKEIGGTGADSEARFQRPKNSRETLMSYGLGVGYRFRMIYEWLKIDDLFETISVYGARHSLNESYRDLNYTGYGFRADYGIHMRATSSFFYGLKGSYNIGKVTRSLGEKESHSDASLAISWISLGFEAGYFY
ncbi:MAG: hypothetical protein ACOYL6_00150 [Bacteriovoracaceae bacterium]